MDCDDDDDAEGPMVARATIDLWLIDDCCHLDVNHPLFCVVVVCLRLLRSFSVGKCLRQVVG